MPSFKNSLIRFYPLLLLLLVPLFAFAELTARVDRQQMVLGESLTLEVVSDKNLSGQPDFSILEAVFHVGQTGRSSSTQIINGAVSTNTTWQVVLVPKSLGSHIIPPLEVGGEKTKTLRITVEKPDPNAKANGDMFIELEPNKTEAYVQEEIQLTVRLLYAIKLKNGALSEPQAEGLIVQQINKGSTYTTQRDGKTYTVLERKYALFSENSGKITLNPLVFEGEITDNRRQSFSMFQRGKPVRQISEMLELDIKQIPAEFIDKPWVPAEQVVLKQSWSENKPYTVGEPITRTIELVAAGLSETQLPDLSITEFEGAKVYQDKTDTITRTDGERLIASKTIKYAVIPTTEGSLNIPEFKLDWFDIKKQKAQSSIIPATSLNISAAETSNNIIAATENQIISPTSIIDASKAYPAADTASHEKPFWKNLTLLFASLWGITLILLIAAMRNKTKQQKQKPLEVIDNSAVFKQLQSKQSPKVQNALIKWWNLNHENKVNNLSQIIHLIEAAETQMALDELQQSLYGPKEQQTTAVDWLKLIKNKGFRLKAEKPSISQGLPELY